MTKMLIVGDPHAHPKYDNDRFELAGRFARIRGVDRIHCVGDWTDNAATNQHKSVREARETAYEDDVEAGNDALARFDEGLDGHPARKTISLGNHDDYPDSYVEHIDPSLRGAMGIKDIDFRGHGWRTIPFRTMEKVAGLYATHYFPTPRTGKAISTMHTAHATASKVGGNTVSGHSHVFDHKIVTFLDGRLAHGFVAGCWVHPKYMEPWVQSTRQLWHEGLLIVETGRKGLVEGFEWVTADKVRREAGK